MLKFENAKCSCGFDLSSAKPGVYHETYPGEYMGHCPSCRGVAQPVVEGEPKQSKAGAGAKAAAEAQAEAEAKAAAEAQAEAEAKAAAEAQAEAEAKAAAEAQAEAD